VKHATAPQWRGFTAYVAVEIQSYSMAMHGQWCAYALHRKVKAADSGVLGIVDHD
jgi:hypothetical protein